VLQKIVINTNVVRW